MTLRKIAIGVGVLALLGSAGAWALAQQRDAPTNVLATEDDDEEVVITLDDLPDAVRKALADITTEAAVTQVARETEDGVTTYDVEYEKDGAQWSAEFSDAGKVLENEVDDDDGDDDD